MQKDNNIDGSIFGFKRINVGIATYFYKNGRRNPLGSKVLNFKQNSST